MDLGSRGGLVRPQLFLPRGVGEESAAEGEREGVRVRCGACEGSVLGREATLQNAGLSLCQCPREI